MTRRPDLGQRIADLANLVTPEHVAELFAVRLANMHETQTPTHPSHWRPDGVYAPLVKAKLIVGEPAPDWSGRGWKRARLTNLGERVLLSVAEQAMVETGRMARFEVESEGE